MLEREMDIWDAPPDAWIGITTNGTVRADGRLVMGRGVAREARDRFPGIDRVFGEWVSLQNTPCFVLGFPPANGRNLFSFPVKHHWSELADLALIHRSAYKLYDVTTQDSWRGKQYYLPRPGCGNGRLRWEDVHLVIEFLPDNVIVVNKPMVHKTEMLHA